MLSGESCENTLFMLDGDVYRTDDEKRTSINRVLTGHDENVVQAREIALSAIKQFTLPIDTKPEKYLHSLIIAIHETDDQERYEIIEVAKEIVVADEDHKYVNDIIDRFGWERAVGLSKIIDLVATTREWSAYTNDLMEWFKTKSLQVLED